MHANSRPHNPYTLNTHASRRLLGGGGELFCQGFGSAIQGFGSVTGKQADFKFLLSALGLTNGNLSVQAGRLEEAGYITISKSFEGKMPRTRYRLTELGRKRLARYWQQMDDIRGAGRAGR
jgi:DNA-binding transcriptional ArsR family regulator